MGMILTIFILYFLCCLHDDVSAADPLGDLAKQGGPCFPEMGVPDECDTTLTECFQSSYNTYKGNEPTTLMYLFTPDNPDVAEPLHKCGGWLPPNTTYDREADTEVFIHGWLDGICRTAWMREMKEQLRQRGRYNVILVDWSWGNLPEYAEAGHNCRIVGEQVAFLINNIMSHKDCGPEKFHLIGHSLGATAAGYVGRIVKGLRRITGLDPAYAPYGKSPPNKRLTYRDAQIVDIIHSNGYECLAEGIGDSRPLGHADFYPNGGQLQTSCYTYLITSLLKQDLFYAIGSSLYPQLCSHVQSLQFYKLSINSNGCEFVGIESRSYEGFLRTRNRTRICRKNWAVMGMNYELYRVKSDKKRRKFYLTTLDSCPYYDNSYLGSKQFPFKVSCTE